MGAGHRTPNDAQGCRADTRRRHPAMTLDSRGDRPRRQLLSWNAVRFAVSNPPPAATQAPAPTNVWAGSYADGSTEFEVNWTASTDNVDAQAFIRYDVYLAIRFQFSMDQSRT
jgi:hypothetical protein